MLEFLGFIFGTIVFIFGTWIGCVVAVLSSLGDKKAAHWVGVSMALFCFISLLVFWYTHII